MRHRICIVLGGLVLVTLAGFNVVYQFAYLRTGERKGHDWQIFLERLSRLNEIAPQRSLIGLEVQDTALPNIEANFTRGHEPGTYPGGLYTDLFLQPNSFLRRIVGKPLKLIRRCRW